MIDQVLNPPDMPMPDATPVGRAQTADRVLAALEEHRATWQFWHLWAETQRQLRGAAIHPADLRDVAASVMEEAIGTDLDAGQKQMVRTVATDRRRVQLVLAPAGAGKTTALKVLADLWTAGGGHVLGLAPSAAAAAQLAEATGITADTVARLTRALDHHQALPDWAEEIGPRTLLLIDEAGMADTPTLDTAISHTLRQGGRVCLVGDDQQLGAIGAGGILADLQNTHGTVRLTQLHRFTDPDEAAATLRVRDGAPDAVDFYTTRDRIRIGDPDGLPDRLLAAWRHDHDQGLDSLMLAPSRRQVADLNHRARAARLACQSLRGRYRGQQCRAAATCC